MGSNGAACFRPFLDIVHFDVQDGGLDAVHAVVVPSQDVAIFGLLPPVAQQRDPLRQRRVGGHGRAALAIGSEILARVEAEAADIADRSGAAALVFGSMGLSCILDHDEPVATGDLHDRIHIGHQPVQMHRHDRLRARRDRGFDGRRIHGPGDGIDIDENGPCAAIEEWPRWSRRMSSKR